MRDHSKTRQEVLSGTLDMLILQTLSNGKAHGYGIAQHLDRLSDGVFVVEQGSLYPALERLLAKGWVTARWSLTPTQRMARYYTITAAGRKQLGMKRLAFGDAVKAIARIMSSKTS